MADTAWTVFTATSVAVAEQSKMPGVHQLINATRAVYQVAGRCFQAGHKRGPTKMGEDMPTGFDPAIFASYAWL
jgi:hypothetical protein